MTEIHNDITSILLPAASVAVYTMDQKTLQSATNIKNDWRFARVDIHVVEGNVSTAIADSKNQTSPSLMIIQTEIIDTAFTDQLAELADFCDEGTSAIVIGPDNDVNLYRRLIDMGVSDYLVKPIETEILSEVIAKALIDKIGVTGSRLIVFVGAKGGMGVSTVAQASACSVAEILGQKTVLLDAACGRSTLSIGLGFEPAATLAQAVRAAENNDENGLARMLHKVSDKLSVLATGVDAMLETTVTNEQFENLIDVLMIRFPVVIVDLSQAAEILKRSALVRANQIIVVTVPTIIALRQARTLIQEIRDFRGGSEEGIQLLINMQGLSTVHEVPKEDIGKALDFTPAIVVPFDAKVFLGNENESRKLSDDKTGKSLIEKILVPFFVRIFDLDSKTDKEPVHAKKGFLDRIFGKFKSRS